MAEGVVNLPRIMRDVLLKRPMGNCRNLFPYRIFISRLASRFQVPVFAGDVFYEVREQDMFCPYGDWKGEQPKVCRGRVIPPLRPPQVQREEQQQPPPAASEIPSISAQHLSEPSLQEIIQIHIDKVLDRHSDETIANNHLRLKTTIDAIRWLAFQACLFRGDKGMMELVICVVSGMDYKLRVAQANNVANSIANNEIATGSGLNQIEGNFSTRGDASAAYDVIT
ncbi:hypothetical protein PIB30_101675 [Stylosanthes scabra]|uniref:Uncharacterized protein n=1 Tax=Stylosanthes scabra TaxID=79078 RepID=A0ABU6XU97_9FABA|nr:hypothetical protein [Stylosanthes scabra]